MKRNFAQKGAVDYQPAKFPRDRRVTREDPAVLMPPCATLLSLPEELLNCIAKLSAAAQYYEDVFDSWAYLEPLGDDDRLIWCQNRGVESLSPTCSRFRRICLPILFASIIIRGA
jgi:hypothetical protein